MRLAVPAAWLPPWQMVYWHLRRWEDPGVTGRIARVLCRELRARHGYDGEPPVVVMDSQSVKAAGTAGAGSGGHGAAKKVDGRKRFLLTGTLGLLVAVLVRPASVQDRAGATTLLLGLCLGSGCRTVFAGQGLAGWPVAWAARVLGIAVRIVAKPAGQRGFVVHPRRWVVERTLGRLMLHRRLARDYERDPAMSEALIRWAAIGQMARRITRGRPARRPGRRPLEYLR